MTLDERFNVLQSEQEQNKQEQRKDNVNEHQEVKQEFEALKNALVALLTEVFGCNDDADDDTDNDVDQEQDQHEDDKSSQHSFDEILKNNIDVLARLKTCDNNTYKNCGCHKAQPAAQSTTCTNQEPTLEPSKYSHWIIKYLWDTKGVIHKADYEYLRQFCDFVMAQ